MESPLAKDAALRVDPTVPEKGQGEKPVESLFPPFPFRTQPVPIATDKFDFETWKREPSGPVILKARLADWPLFQNLKSSVDDDARLDYLSSAFGNAKVGYTKIPSKYPLMGYDEHGNQNFRYSPWSCKLSHFCGLMRTALHDPDSDILYARGGANAVRTWKGLSQAIHPFEFLRDMEPSGEGIWLGTGRHISYLHHDALFNFFAMITGVKRVLLYPLEAIGNLYPTPYYGGIAGTTSSFVRPCAPDLERFPRFQSTEKQAFVATLEEGDLLCLPPCWWHYVEAAPGLNLMINAFVWALAPQKLREFHILMRESIGIALSLRKEELLAVRERLYPLELHSMPARSTLSRSAKTLLHGLSVFLKPNIPGYWQQIARCYYDHYVFQLNGHPVSTYPERHTRWVRQEKSPSQQFRQWFRFNRSLLRMRWQRKRATGIVP
jgi:Cupin-like domain